MIIPVVVTFVNRSPVPYNWLEYFSRPYKQTCLYRSLVWKLDLDRSFLFTLSRACFIFDCFAHESNIRRLQPLKWLYARMSSISAHSPQAWRQTFICCALPSHNRQQKLACGFYEENLALRLLWPLDDKFVRQNTYGRIVSKFPNLWTPMFHEKVKFVGLLAVIIDNRWMTWKWNEYEI